MGQDRPGVDHEGRLLSTVGASFGRVSRFSGATSDRSSPNAAKQGWLSARVGHAHPTR